MKPGTAVLSDLANEHGVLLLQTFGTALGRLGVSVDQSALSKPIPTDKAPQLSLLQTTAALEAPATTLAQRYQLDQPASAHACAIAAAILIQKAQSVLDPGVGAAIAIYGLVEGSKTMPPPLSGSAQP